MSLEVLVLFCRKLAALQLLLALVIFSSSSFSHAKNCSELLKSRTLARKMKYSQGSDEYLDPWATAKVAAEEYQKSPEWVKALLPEKQVVKILENAELSLFISHLNDVLKELNAKGTRLTALASQEALALKIFRELPLNKIENRVGRGEILSVSLFEKKNVLNALGFRTLDQMQDLLYGSDLSNPAPSSLVGYYVKKTGAKYVMNSFSKGPAGRSRGESRMALALSAKTMPLYKTLFELPEFFFHVHTPAQGTLYVAHNGSHGSYANLSHPLQLPQLETLMPLVLMSSSEANRMFNYFQLSKIDVNYPEDNQPQSLVDGRDCAQYPWNLEGYCASGGYTCCTHWVGNIPIGDKLVAAYSFPGNVDSNANNADGPGAQTKRLKEYEHLHPMVHLVWQVPGHQQLADVLGARRKNLAGEFANPGWVFHTLAGAVSPDRVPIVFYVVEDHREEIETPIEERTSPY